MTKAVIYTRFSPQKNSELSQSCHTQESICRRYAKDKGYSVTRVLNDKDVSGADDYRPKLWESIESLGKGDVLIVYKRDRLARNVYLSEQINRLVTKRCGTIEAVSGDIDGNGPEHIMVRQMLASVAEYERKLIAKRTSHAMTQHQKDGFLMSRYAPYGTEQNEDDVAAKVDDPTVRVRLEPVEIEQEAIEVIQRFVDDGGNSHSIAIKMNRVMPEAARSGKWNATTVARIMKRL